VKYELLSLSPLQTRTILECEVLEAFLVSSLSDENQSPVIQGLIIPGALGHRVLLSSEASKQLAFTLYVE